MPILDKKDKVQVAKYNEFIRNREQVSITQDYAFLVSNKSNDFEIVYLEKNGYIVASMAVLIVDILKKKKVFYCNNGPVCDIYDINVVKELINELQPLVKKHNPIYLVMEPKVEKEDKLNLLYKKHKYKIDTKAKLNRQIVLNIAGKTEEQIISGLNDKTKYNLETSQKKNVKIKISTTKRDFEKFLELYKSEKQLQIQDIKNFEMFKGLLSSFDEDVIRVYTASIDGKVLGGAIATRFGKAVRCLEEVFIKESNATYARTKLHFEIIKWGLENNCDIYEMGILDDKLEADARFKEGFTSKTGVVEYVGKIYKIYNKPMYILNKIKKLEEYNDKF
ncbi:MAG: peptidoglycan bridge formation glycyltransferase FemA/FemB family protein [Clostridia bacterium]|nr:peptidoglycan bridge formation glycyltransferase FemA/FemB family protein [Clostridia bacterium]